MKFQDKLINNGMQISFVNFEKKCSQLSGQVTESTPWREL